MGEQTVGLYATFLTSQAIADAVNKSGWPGIGAVAAQGSTSYPYTEPHVYNGQTMDEIVEAAYSQANFWWLDYWTVSGPSSSATDSEWQSAGHAAGVKAAQTIMSAVNAPNSLGFVPAYVVIDLEGEVVPSTAGQFTSIVKGWAAGIQSVTSQLSPALYSDQYQWSSYNLNSLNVPGIVAVSPIAGNKPYASGGNIFGYGGYYGSCSNGSASDDVSTIQSWGKNLNTLQFSGSGNNCGP